MVPGFFLSGASTGFRPATFGRWPDIYEAPQSRQISSEGADNRRPVAMTSFCVYTHCSNAKIAIIFEKTKKTHFFSFYPCIFEFYL